MSRSKKTWNHLVDFYGNYGIDIKNGVWPGSGPARKGDKGDEGPEGKKGERGLRGAAGPIGKKGDVGPEGSKGLKGDSAYEIALDNGFVGTEIEYLDSLKGNKGEKGEKGEQGSDGLDAYQTAVKGGFKGTYSEWEEYLEGEKGQKGDQGGIFTYKGKEDSLADIESLPGPHEPGDVYQDDSTDDLYVWDGSQFVLLSEQLDVVKGQKGEKGNKGDEGISAYEQAVAGGFIGTEIEWVESLKGDKGDTGEKGLSAYEIAVNQGFPGDEIDWLQSLEGQKGEDGEKGDKGIDGEKGIEGDSAYEVYAKGTTDNPVLSETEWVDSLKGDKGNEADPHQLDNYYDKGQVDELFETYPNPKDAYSINFMDDEAIIESGLVDFLDSDQNAAHYERGMIELRTGVIAANCPLTPPFLLINHVIVDETIPRGVDYTVMQRIVSVDATGGESFTRTARPGNDEFGEWFRTSFDIDDYYNKTSVDEKIDAIDYTLGHNLSSLTLTDKDSNIQTVNLLGQNGISIYSTKAGIHFDTSDLAGAQFLGVLNDGQDPDDEHANLQVGNKTQGQFFIYAYEGVTVNTNPDAASCTVGDWCIYSSVDSEWKYLNVSTDPGVVEIQTAGGLLTVDSTDPARPVIQLDSSSVVQPDELESYVTKETAAAAFSAQNLEDLSDVEISFVRANPGGVSSAYIAHGTLVDGVPSDNGEYAVDVANNEIHFYYKGNSGALMDGSVYDWIDVDEDSTLVRLTENNFNQSVVAHPTGKRKEGMVRVIEFDEPNPALFAIAAKGVMVLDIVTNNVDDGDVLTWNGSTGNWENKDLGLDVLTTYVKKTGDTMSGDLNLEANVDINFIGNNAGINLKSPYFGGLKYDGQLILEWKSDAVQTSRDFNMKLGNVALGNAEAESQYNGADQYGGHAIHWLKSPEHKYDATNKQWVEDKIQHDINFNNYTELT